MKYIQLLLFVLWCSFSTTLDAQSTAKKPVAKKTTVAAKKPVAKKAPAKKPATAAKKAPAKKPATAAKKAPAKKPTTAAKKAPAKKPTTAAKKKTPAKKPTTAAKKKTPAKKPATAAKKPAPVAPKPTTTRPSTAEIGTTKCTELTKVAQIQCCLREKGYDPGETDNTLNAKTRAALIQFQKDHHLPQGDLSIETMRALGVSK